MVLYDRNIIGTSSEIFGYLRISSKNVRRRSSSLWNNFGNSSEILGKWSEIFGKSSKTSLLVCVYNKQNNTWTLGDMEFIFSCSHSISHSFAALTRSISMWTLEDKFHISARPCIILYLFFNRVAMGRARFIIYPWFIFSIFFNRAAMGRARFIIYPWFIFRRFVGDQTRISTRPY